MHTILKWLRRQLVEPVPPGTAACEFECRVAQCLHRRWVDCPRRLTARQGALRDEAGAIRTG